MYRHLPPIKSPQAASSSTWINRSHLLFFPVEFMKHELMSQPSNLFPFPVLSDAADSEFWLCLSVRSGDWIEWRGIRGGTELMSVLRVIRRGIQMWCQRMMKCARHLLDEVIINVSENSRRHWSGIDSNSWGKYIQTANTFDQMEFSLPKLFIN